MIINATELNRLNDVVEIQKAGGVLIKVRRLLDTPAKRKDIFQAPGGPKVFITQKSM